MTGTIKADSTITTFDGKMRVKMSTKGSGKVTIVKETRDGFLVRPAYVRSNPSLFYVRREDLRLN